MHIAGQRHANYSRDTAAIQGVALDNNDRTAKSRRTTGAWRQIRPPDFPLHQTYHSVRSKVRLAAARTNESMFSPTSLQTLFIASVIMWSVLKQTSHSYQMRNSDHSVQALLLVSPDCGSATVFQMSRVNAISKP